MRRPRRVRPQGLGPWQEEVRLSDGRMVVVERYEESEVRQPIADVGAAFLTVTTVKFVAPPELAMLPDLSTQYRPLILDFDPAIGTWFVIAFDERVCRTGSENGSGARWTPLA